MKEVIEAVTDWLTGEEMLIQEAYAFADQYCHAFTAPATPGEHKLEFTELHKQFQTVFEEKLNAKLVSLGVEPEQFHAALEAMKDDESTEMLIQFLIAMTDYDFFIQVMEERKAALYPNGVPSTFSVAVPDGAGPELTVLAPNGQEMVVAVPEGVSAGVSFEVQYMAA
jgi:hypothetical protein